MGRCPLSFGHPYGAFSETGCNGLGGEVGAPPGMALRLHGSPVCFGEASHQVNSGSKVDPAH